MPLYSFMVFDSYTIDIGLYYFSIFAVFRGNIIIFKK